MNHAVGIVGGTVVFFFSGFFFLAMMAIISKNQSRGTVLRTPACNLEERKKNKKKEKPESGGAAGFPSRLSQSVSNNTVEYLITAVRPTALVSSLFLCHTRRAAHRCRDMFCKSREKSGATREMCALRGWTHARLHLPVP